MTKFVGGALQADFMARVREVDPGRCLVVPVDIGKWSAMALVADHYGEVIVEPFEFPLTEPGVQALLVAVARAEAKREAQVCRVGVECTGHYHRTLVSRLGAAGLEVVQLNPAAVKEARSQQLLRSLKSDARDLGAMAELMVRGGGRPPQVRSDAVAAQLAWVGHRRRKLGAHQALANQVQGQLDLVFPGLDGCFAELLHAKAGRIILADICDPDRICHLGAERLRAFVGRRGVRLSRPKAAQVVQAARAALRLPPAERAVLAAVLATDVALLATLEAELTRAETTLAEILPATPAAILTSLPGVGVIRASAYGAGIGEPGRFGNAAPIGPRGWSRPSTTRPARNAGGASTSAGKARPCCGKPSSNWAEVSPATTTTSPPTVDGSSTSRRRRPALPPWPLATAPTASPLPCCALVSPMTRSAGGPQWPRLGPRQRSSNAHRSHRNRPPPPLLRNQAGPDNQLAPT